MSNSNDIGCREVQLILDGSVFADLDPGVRGQLKAHVANCPACAKALEAAMKLDEELTVALVGAEPPPAAAPSSSWNWRSWLWKPVAIASALALSIFGGKQLEFIEVTKHFRQAEAGEGTLPVPIGLENGGFNGDFRSWKLEGKIASASEQFDGKLPGEWSKARSYEHYESFDPNEGFSAPGSAKLLQRNYGGTISRKIELPLPSNSTVRMTYWIKSPKGSTRKNKVFVGGLSVCNGPSVSEEHFAGSPFWVPKSLTLSMPTAPPRTPPAPGFQIAFSTGSGDGEYKGMDWATWIDDVSVQVSIPIELVRWWIEGDVIRVEFALPQPYSTNSMSEADLKLESAFGSFPAVAGKVIARNHIPESSPTAIWEFRSPEAVSEFEKDNPFESAEGIVSFRGRAHYRGYTVEVVGGLRNRQDAKLRERLP